MPRLHHNVRSLELRSSRAQEERRATLRAVAHWESQLGERVAPLFSEFHFAEAPDWNAAQFLLKQDNMAAHSVFIVCGDSAAASFGSRPVRMTLQESVPAELRDRMIEDCEQAVRVSGPAGSEGWYLGEGRKRMHYRYIFLPLDVPVSEHGYIFGAYSCTARPARRSAAPTIGRKSRETDLVNVVEGQSPSLS